MATWIHHLLTKLQQMKLIRSSFRCCAWLEKEWHWAPVAPCLGLAFRPARRKARRASCEWKADAEWKLGRPRDCWRNRSAVLHLHTNWCVYSMALCLWAPKLWGRARARRCYTSWRSNARRIFTPSPLQPCKADFWPKIQPKPGVGDLAINPSKLEFWRAVRPKPGAGDLAIESSKLEFWLEFQPKPGAGDLAIGSSKLEFWQWFQHKPGAGDLAIGSSKLAFWPLFQPKPGAGDLAIESSKLEFWSLFQPKPGAGDLAIASSQLELWC